MADSRLTFDFSRLPLASYYLVVSHKTTLNFKPYTFSAHGSKLYSFTFDFSHLTPP